MEGAVKVGETLTAKVTPSGATVSYKWQRSASEDKISEFNDIPGATAETYVLTEEDLDRWIKVEVTGTGNYTGTKTSNAVGLVGEPIDLEADFLADLSTAVEAIEVAKVTLDGANISVVFNDGVTVEEVTEAAQGLVEALGKFAEEGSTLTIGEDTFTLNEDFDLVALAKALLDGTSAEDFLTEGESVTANYTAEIGYKGGTVNLEGSVTFKMGEAD